MDVKDMEYVVTVARLKSFSKAAAALYVSQPALSQSIKKLENKLNIELFYRDKIKVEVTEAGVEFVKEAEEILKAITQLEMRWRLLDLFRSERFQTASEFENVRSVLQSYLCSGESADYQLAGQLADIFDQYLVYRPQWIDAWQEGKLLGLGEDEVWQAQLWRYLDDGNQSAPHRVALWEKLLSSLDKAHLPERFFVFGISTMAPMYLQLLQKISEHCDVFVFALNPSGLYWGNVIEAAQLLKGGDDADLSQTGHPLLASLGKQGRDFFDFLTEIGLEEQPVFEEVSDDTLLHCLQNDIQNLRMPSEHSRTDLLGDGSVRIVSAHSPLRELQILKDKLLRILHEHPDWQPHDIAVLTPNIEPYSRREIGRASCRERV